jgi:hypothetical protein
MSRVTARQSASGSGLCAAALAEENRRYAGSGGLSQNNSEAGFEPAYRDRRSGRVVRSCFADGRPAPIHVLEGLPAEWVSARDADHRVVALDDNIVAGFIRQGRFYTREEAAAALA